MVFFGDIAADLIGKPADVLVNEFLSSNVPIPPEISRLVGRSYVVDVVVSRLSFHRASIDFHVLKFYTEGGSEYVEFTSGGSPSNVSKTNAMESHATVANVVSKHGIVVGDQTLAVVVDTMHTGSQSTVGERLVVPSDPVSLIEGNADLSVSDHSVVASADKEVVSSTPVHGKTTGDLAEDSTPPEDVVAEEMTSFINDVPAGMCCGTIKRYGSYLTHKKTEQRSSLTLQLNESLVWIEVSYPLGDDDMVFRRQLRSMTTYMDRLRCHDDCPFYGLRVIRFKKREMACVIIYAHLPDTGSNLFGPMNVRYLNESAPWYDDMRWMTGAEVLWQLSCSHIRREEGALGQAALSLVLDKPLCSCCQRELAAMNGRVRKCCIQEV